MKAQVVYIVAYNALQLDVLKELINIGGGHGATSLSQLIDKPVNMSVPFIEMMEYKELYEKIMAEDQIVYGVVTQVYGDAGGIFLFALTEPATELVTTMMIPEGLEQTPTLKESAVKELVNIIVNSFLMAVCKELKVSISTSVPLLQIDMFGSLISSLYLALDQYEEQVMIIKNEFLYEGDTLEASLYFIPNEGVLNKLFQTIGV